MEEDDEQGVDAEATEQLEQKLFERTSEGSSAVHA